MVTEGQGSRMGGPREGEQAAFWPQRPWGVCHFPECVQGAVVTIWEAEPPFWSKDTPLFPSQVIM